MRKNQMTTATLEYKTISLAEASQSAFVFSVDSSDGPYESDVLEAQFREAIKRITPDNLRLIEIQPPAEWISEDWS